MASAGVAAVTVTVILRAHGLAGVFQRVRAIRFVPHLAGRAKLVAHILLGRNKLFLLFNTLLIAARQKHRGGDCGNANCKLRD